MTRGSYSSQMSGQWKQREELCCGRQHPSGEHNLGNRATKHKKIVALLMPFSYNNRNHMDHRWLFLVSNLDLVIFSASSQCPFYATCHFVCQDGAWKRANPSSSWGFREGGMPQEILRMDIWWSRWCLGKRGFVRKAAWRQGWCQVEGLTGLCYGVDFIGTGENRF